MNSERETPESLGFHELNSRVNAIFPLGFSGGKEAEKPGVTVSAVMSSKQTTFWPVAS